MAPDPEHPKIVLFHPHLQGGHYDTNQQQPTNLLSISGLPDRLGFRVVIVDASITKDYRREVLRECRGALCFGTTSLIGYQAWHAARMSKEVKARFPALPVVAGGWFPSVLPEMVLEQGGADIVVLRQGERTFMEVLEALRSGSPLEGIEGIAFRNGEEVARTLDYFSSYGCPDACTFCTSPSVTGRRWTALDAERVVDEVDRLVRSHRFNFLKFVDANWGVDRHRVRGICEGLIRRETKVHWAATIESRTLNGFDAGLLDLMAESGCVKLYIGAEASHPSTLEMTRKRIRPGDIFRSCERCIPRKIVPIVSYIIGFPGETGESIQATLEESCELLYRWPQLDVPLFVYLPLPGTPLYRKAIEMGYRPPTALEHWARYEDKVLAEIISSLGAPGGEALPEGRPERLSGITRKQMRILRRCRRHYVWWGSERSKGGRPLTPVEKVLRWTSRRRLKHKWFALPVEYWLYALITRAWRRLGAR